MSAETYTPPESISGLQSQGMIAAIVGAVIAALGFAMTGADRFYEAYLVAWTFWSGVALGSLALLMLHHLTGGAWGLVIRRILEAATRTIPAMAVLFLPILLGMGHLYHWTHPTDDPVILDKAAYLNVPFFLARAGLLLHRVVVDGLPAERVVGRTGSHRRPDARRQDDARCRAADCCSAA